MSWAEMSLLISVHHRRVTREVMRRALPARLVRLVGVVAVVGIALRRVLRLGKRVN